MLAFHLLAWRRLWAGTVFSAFLSPLLFLVAMGYGLGSLVGRGGRLVDGVSYLAFVTPGVMAVDGDADGDRRVHLAGAVRASSGSGSSTRCSPRR